MSRFAHNFEWLASLVWVQVISLLVSSVISLRLYVWVSHFAHVSSDARFVSDFGCLASLVWVQVSLLAHEFACHFACRQVAHFARVSSDASLRSWFQVSHFARVSLDVSLPSWVRVSFFDREFGCLSSIVTSGVPLCSSVGCLVLFVSSGVSIGSWVHVSLFAREFMCLASLMSSGVSLRSWVCHLVLIMFERRKEKKKNLRVLKIFFLQGISGYTNFFLGYMRKSPYTQPDFFRVFRNNPAVQGDFCYIFTFFTFLQIFYFFLVIFVQVLHFFKIF